MAPAPDLEVTGIAQQRAWAERAFPAVEQVAPNVWSVPVDCSAFPIRYTFSYVLVGADGDFIVLDPGLDTPLGRTQLVGAIERIGLQLDRLRAVVVSHFHADHLSMANWLTAVSGAPLAMHGLDAAIAARMADIDTLASLDSDWVDALAVPASQRVLLTLDASDLDRFSTFTSVQIRLADGLLLPLADRTVRCIWTPGHTPGHVCLVDEDNGLLLAGDHILPRITPNVGITPYDEPLRDAVGEYADSLRKLRHLDALEVCPAHEYRFRGLTARCDDLLGHQAARSNEVAQVLDERPDATPWEIARALTWSRGWDELNGQSLRAALAETAAHVRHLQRSS